MRFRFLKEREIRCVGIPGATSEAGLRWESGNPNNSVSPPRRLRATRRSAESGETAEVSDAGETGGTAEAWAIT